MSDNTYKQSTGYYTLQILRAIDVDAGAKDLYVEIVVKDTVQRTRLIKKAPAFWDETFPIRVPMGKTPISLSLFRRSSVLPMGRCLGTSATPVSELVQRCSGRKETTIALLHGHEEKSRVTIAIILEFSDIRENATIALQNLLPLASEDGEIPFESERLDPLLEKGKAVMRSNVSHSIAEAFPQVDSFVELVDDIAKAHPLLNVGWQLVSALYWVASEQIILDKQVNGLIKTLVTVFEFIADASRLADVPEALSSLRRTIVKLLDQLIECSLFIREYSRRNFLKRVVKQAKEKKKVANIMAALDLLREELKQGIILQIAFLVMDSGDGGKDTHGSERALREIRESFGLSPIMLSEMESSNHRKCMMNTRGEWIDEISEWAVAESDKNIFWLRGIPGSGKSTIALTVADLPQLKTSIVSHIFFQRENTRRHDILQIIAYKLALFNPSLAPLIAARLRSPRPTLHASFTNLLLEPLQEAEGSGVLQGPTVIILDALDEYGTSESRVPLMQLFQNEFSKLPHRVRFLITSRPEADLVKALSFQEHIDGRELDHKNAESRRDVSAYITAEMKQLVPGRASEGPSWAEKMAIFGGAADGLFIWAAVAVDLVRRSQRPYKKICALASNETKLTLDDLYAKALEAADLDWKDADTRQLFASLLALILPNRGSLTIELLDLLLGFEGDSSEASLFKLQSFLSYTAFGPVQIHHKTFADFLQSPARLPAEPWYINSTHENVFIVERCFSAMEELRFDMCGSVTHSSLEALIGDIAPHILYASLYWADHLRGAEFSLEILNYLRAFLSERLLFWFEVLSHLKEFTRVASQALLNAMGWVSVHDINMSSFLRDAIAIAFGFSSVISKAPKLIYATALPLSRKTNRVSAQYTDAMARPIQMEEIGATFDVEERQPMESLMPFSDHDKSVNSVIFSPDMRYVISGSDDRTVRVWNAQTGEAITAPLRGHSRPVTGVAVSPEGGIIASGSYDGTLRLWNADAGSIIGEALQGHKRGVSSVAFSPDGHRIASASDDQTIRVRDVETGKAIGKPLDGHSDPVVSVSWSPDGKMIVSGSEDGTIRVWDADKYLAVGEPLCGHDSAVRSVVHSPDGRWIASGSDDKTIRIWDSKSGESLGEALRGHQGTVRAVAFSPDGRRIVSCSEDSTLRFWDTNTRTFVGDPLQEHKCPVLSVAYSRDGSRIVSSDVNGRIIVWDANTGKPIVGTGIQPRPTAQIIAEEGESFNADNYQFFSGWKIEEGWLIGVSGEHRLWLPGYKRGLVKQGDQGLYVHRELDLANCNGAAEGHKGITFSDRPS